MSTSDSAYEFSLDELLAGRALGDLTPEESARLESLLAEHPQRDTDEFDYVVAALIAGNAPTVDLPDSLRANLEHQAPAYLPLPSRRPAAQRILSGREMLAWAIALSCMVLVVFQLWPVDVGGSPSLAAQREALLRSTPDAVSLEWGPGLHPFEDAVGGDVVWSNSRQRGYLRFTNMPINDPSVEQYQLWIIDPQRDEEPIDGGVFDIASTGEVIVPIDAKLKVIAPQAFAVTIEQPGGVVVSSQERLPLLAKLEP